MKPALVNPALMTPGVQHLHTYFLFPFSIDKEAVMEDHGEIWNSQEHWFEHLDGWVTNHVAINCDSLKKNLGGWQRCSYNNFDASSAAYQDMVFFHPFIRRTFFDTGQHDTHHEALLRCYRMPVPAGSLLRYEAEDTLGNSASVELSEIQLLLFANGIGILLLGVESRDIPYTQALWINEMMRKIYPSSDRQLASGRIPCRMALVQEREGERLCLAEERFADSRLVEFRPRLSKLLLDLLYFANYDEEEYEPVLDERMIVNTFVAFHASDLPPGFEVSEGYEALLSRFLYVDLDGEGFRYAPEFVTEQMNRDLYRRWQHEGTVYGMTSYSQLTATVSQPSSLVYRMFTTKNRLVSLIALFYRATLLDFSKESALVSRQLFPIFSGQVVRHRHIQLATHLMADFHYFDNYWYFSEITPKDEEFEHFRLLCNAYRISALKEEVGDQIGRLAGYIDRMYALRNNDAVNRLGMLSMILGLGALVTGYYGMNIPHLTSILGSQRVSGVSFVTTLVMTVLSIGLIGYIVAANWIDYRSSLVPRQLRRTQPRKSIRRVARNTGQQASDK